MDLHPLIREAEERINKHTATCAQCRSVRTEHEVPGNARVLWVAIDTTRICPIGRLLADDVIEAVEKNS